MSEPTAKKKPGPKPRSAAGALTATVGFRLRPETRAALELAARKEWRSVSEECERRIVQSVEQESAPAFMFGAEEDRSLIMAICNAIRSARRWSDGTGSNDNEVYAAILATVEGMAGRGTAEIMDDAKKSDDGAWERAAYWAVGAEKGWELPENKPLSEIMRR